MQPRAFSAGMKLLTVYYGPIGGDKLAADDVDKLTALYWRGLQDLADGGFDLAVTEAIKRCKFWPRVSELREWAAPYRQPAVVGRYNTQQIEEFSEQTREQAKAALRRLGEGLENWQEDASTPGLQLVKPVDRRKMSDRELTERVERLRDQARVLGVSA